MLYEVITSIRVANDGASMERFEPGIGLSNLQERLERLCNGSLEIVSFDPPVFLIKIRSDS